MHSRLRNRIFFLSFNLYARCLKIWFLLIWIVSIHDLRIFQLVALNFWKSKFIENSIYVMILNEVKVYTSVCVDVIFYCVKVAPSSCLYTFGKRAPSTQSIPNEKYYESYYEKYYDVVLWRGICTMKTQKLSSSQI